MCRPTHNCFPHCLIGLVLAGTAWLLGAAAPAGNPGADPAPTAQPKPMQLAEHQAQVAAGKYALVVGIDNYAAPEIAHLHYSEADARAVAEVLVRYCGFPVANVELLLGPAATEEAILTRLDALSNAQLYTGADTLLFYFSGHGAVFDARGDGANAVGTRDNYLLPYDGSVNPAMVLLRNVPLENIKVMLDRSVFARKVVLIDACRNELRVGARGSAGGFDEASWADRYGTAQGLKLLVSTQTGQVSWEDPSLGHGIFTYYLLQGLQGQAADDQGVVTVGRLAEFVEQGMSAYSRQNPTRLQLPTLLGEGMVNIPLAVVNPNAPPLPPELFGPSPADGAPRPGQFSLREQDGWRVLTSADLGIALRLPLEGTVLTPDNPAWPLDSAPETRLQWEGQRGVQAGQFQLHSFNFEHALSSAEYEEYVGTLAANFSQTPGLQLSAPRQSVNLPSGTWELQSVLDQRQPDAPLHYLVFSHYQGARVYTLDFVVLGPVTQAWQQRVAAIMQSVDIAS